MDTEILMLAESFVYSVICCAGITMARTMGRRNMNLEISVNIFSKGSYYANPILDVPTTDDALLSRYSNSNIKISPPFTDNVRFREVAPSIIYL
jgi:hypothetical protein